MTNAFLRRQPEQALIRGEWVDGYLVRRKWVRSDSIEDVNMPMGVVAGDAWWDLPLPKCPDCGGTLLWAENGNVPGTRKCFGEPVGSTEAGEPQFKAEGGGCGSLFTVALDRDGDAR